MRQLEGERKEGGWDGMGRGEERGGMGWNGVGGGEREEKIKFTERGKV